MIWLLTGYMWLFVHRPFEVWPWIGPYRIERIYMLFTLLCWVLSTEKGRTRNRLNVAFFVMAAAIVLSSLLSPYAHELSEK